MRPPSSTGTSWSMRPPSSTGTSWSMRPPSMTGTSWSMRPPSMTGTSWSMRPSSMTTTVSGASSCASTVPLKTTATMAEDCRILLKIMLIFRAVTTELMVRPAAAGVSIMTLSGRFSSCLDYTSLIVRVGQGNGPGSVLFAEIQSQLLLTRSLEAAAVQRLLVAIAV